MIDQNYTKLNTGSVANDGTGDTLRGSMQKIQSNFENIWIYGNSRNRQSLIEYSRDSSNSPNFISGSGLFSYVSGSLMCSIMSGISSRGEMNIFFYTTGSIISGGPLTANSNNYMVLSYDTGSNSFSIFNTTSSYTDSYTFPVSPSESDLMVSRINYRTLRFVSGFWVDYPFIVLANITTNGTGISSISYFDRNEDLDRSKKDSIKYSLIFG